MTLPTRRRRPQSRSLRRLGAAGICFMGLALASSCSPHHTVNEPASPVELPQSYGTAGGEADASLPDKWWETFGDPELNHLVDEALGRNFQLGAAWARLERARAGAQMSSAGYWPQVSAQLDVSRRRQVMLFGALGRQEFEADSYSVSVPVSYEVDLWNRVGHQVAAAGADVLASRDDVEALAMTVAANVVERWLDVLQQRAAQTLIREQVETNRVYAELVGLRFQHGLSGAVDIYQQRGQLHASEAQLAQVTGAEAVARQQLAVLTGRAPSAFAGQIGALPEPTVLPDPLPIPNMGVPADLLLRRPDVRAARQRVVAQDHRLGAAIADQFPALRLNGSFGLSSPTLEDLLSSFVWSIAGGLLAPVLDGGRRAAVARQNRAALRESVQAFAQSLLNAMLEVESALVRSRQLEVQLQSLRAQREASAAALIETRQRYTEGLTDYLPVLTALAASQRADQSVLNAERQLLSQRVQLARALGGGWTAELEAPRLPDPQDTSEDDDDPGTESSPAQEHEE